MAINRKKKSLLVFAFLAGAFAATSALAQTVYPPSPPDHYLPMSQTLQPAPASSTSGVVSSGAVVYSPDQYPTAQGQFLKLPGGYQQPVSYQPPPQPVAPAPVPTPTPAAPQYVPSTPSVPVAPLTVASTTPPIVTPPPAPVVNDTPAPPPAAYTPPAPQAAPARAQTVTPTAYGDLPTYTYDPSLDPAHPPYKTPIAHDPPALKGGIAIGTLSGVDIGLKFSDYDNQQDTTRGGAAVGLTLDATEVTPGGWFFSGDVRGDYGFFSNTSGGSFLFDARGLVGHDFLQESSNGSYALSPYIGLGYRYLYGDTADFVYLPLGVTQNIRLTRTTRLSVNTELDVDLNDSDVYGLRGNVMYQWSSWSIGPFLEYWSLASGSNNDAVEFGAQVRYRF